MSRAFSITGTFRPSRALLVLATILAMLPSSRDTFAQTNECRPLELARLTWHIRPGRIAPGEVQRLVTQGPVQGMNPVSENSPWVRATRFPILPNRIFPAAAHESMREMSTYTIIPGHDIQCRKRNALLFASIGEAYRIFWNGRLLLDAYTIRGDDFTAYNYRKNLIVPLTAPVKPGANVLFIQLAGRAPAGPLSPNIYFGLGRTGGYVLADEEKLRTDTSQIFFFSIAGIYAFFGLYHLWFFLRRPDSRTHAYFAGMSICLALYLMAFSNPLIRMAGDTRLNLTIGFACQPPMLFFGVLFIRAYFLGERPMPVWMRILLGSNLLISLSILLLPVDYFQSLIRLWYLIVLPQFMYMFALVARALREKIPDSRSIALSISAVCISGLWDIVDSVFFSTGIRLIHFGFFTFVIGLMAIMANRFLKLHREVERMAHYDALTALPNRNLFLKLTDEALANTPGNASSRPAVLVIKLTNLRYIHDAMGRAAGETIINTSMVRLNIMRDPRDCLARIGRDKFGLLLFNTSNADLSARADEILKTLSRAVHVGATDVTVSTGIGIAPGNSAYKTGEEMLRDAFTALDRTPRGMPGYSVFESRMHDAVHTRLRMQFDLERAIQNDDLGVLYQPIIHAHDGRLLGAEALVRWIHPTMGAVSPADFIPIAESSGLIAPLGRRVLETACAQQREWREKYDREPAISVNVSVLQLLDPVFPATVRETLSRTGTRPEHLILEMTESVFMRDQEPLLECLRALRALGVRIAVDDFGTGYSSLSYLHKYPVDILKIDRSFTRDLPGSQEAAAITRTVLGLARGLNLSVTAEGVETGEQLDFLRDENCDAVQGFLFSRPVTGGTIGRMDFTRNEVPVEVPVGH